MPYPLNKDFTYTFYPVLDDDYVSVENTPVTIYVYSFCPTREQAINGTGSPVQTITSWTDTSDGNGKSISISAIDDPAPTSSVNEYTYYIAINYKLTASADTDTQIQALPLQRIVMHQNAITISATDIKGINVRIADNFTDAEITSAISAAKNLNQQELDNLGFKWATIWRPDKLTEAIKYKACYMLLRGNQAESEDVWKDIAELYYETYQNIFSGLRLEYKDSQFNSGYNVHEVQTAKTIRVSR